MLSYEKGNIVTGNYPVIVHQVNCQGVMGAGLAKQIRNRYPCVFLDYQNALKYEGAALGHIIISYESGLNGKMIVSFLSQDKYGHDRKYTDYDAFKKCLNVLKRKMDNMDKKFTVAFPYGIGCGLAGGDWNVIHKMIKGFSETVKQDVKIVSLR